MTINPVKDGWTDRKNWKDSTAQTTGALLLNFLNR